MRRIIASQVSNESIVIAAVECLRKGGLVIFPTETTYGAGVDATNQGAVDKLLAYKSRREGKPLSIAVTNQQMAEQYVALNEQARTLYQQFLPGPMTVISKDLKKVASGVASEFGTLGVRIPDYELVQKIIANLSIPITATSANASGKPRPYNIDHLLKNLSAKQQTLIDLIIDAGELPPNPPSTVIDTTLSVPVTLRGGSAVLLEREQSTEQLKSVTPTETKQIAGRLLLKKWEKIKSSGLVIGLSGELGVGKTVFTSGVAEFLQIDEPITSPTYHYLASYQFNRHGYKGMLHHLDLWKIQSETELERLNIERILHSGSVVIIEWWSQVEAWLLPLIKKSGLAMMVVTISETDNLVGKVTDKLVSNPTGKSTNKLVGKSINKLTSESTSKLTSNSTNKSTKKLIDKSTDYSSGKSVENLNIVSEDNPSEMFSSNRQITIQEI